MVRVKSNYHSGSPDRSHAEWWNQPSLFAYWLWSCVVTVLILLTKYWRPSGVTLLNYFLKPRGITSACWKCSTDGRSISLAATIRPPLHPHPHQPLSHHYQLAMLVLPQCFFFVELRQANANNIWLKKNECTYQLHPKKLMWDSKTAPERVPWDSIW